MSRKRTEESELLLLIGETVKSIRRLKKLSQEQLAETADLHVTRVSDLECGKANLSIINLEKIAKALNVHISELLPTRDNTNKGLKEQLINIASAYEEFSEKDKARYLNMLNYMTQMFKE